MEKTTHLAYVIISTAPLKGDITWPLLENAYLQEIGNVPREEDLRYFKQKTDFCLFIEINKFATLSSFEGREEPNNKKYSNV